VIGSKNEPKWIPLGAAAEIEKNVEIYRKSVRYGYVAPRDVEAYRESERANRDESTLHVVLRGLHDQLWVPIEKALSAGGKTIILSPGGALNFISFACGGSSEQHSTKHSFVKGHNRVCASLPESDTAIWFLADQQCLHVTLCAMKTRKIILHCWGIKMKAIVMFLCVIGPPVLLPAQMIDNLSLISRSLEPRKQSEKPGQKIADAEAALARAKSQDPRSLETADAASALADLYLKVGDYERASPWIATALKIRSEILGDHSLETSASYHQFAEFREELGAFEEAEKLYDDALNARQQADPNSLETAVTLHAMGRLLSKMNKLEDAKSRLRSALAIRKAKLPLDDVETAHTLYELARIEASAGNDSEARNLAERARQIFEAKLGSDDPNADDARLMMEPLSDSIGEVAFGLGRRILDIGPGMDEKPVRTQFFLTGPYNPQEAERLSDYGNELLRSGDANEREHALYLQERSLRIRQRVLGPEHPKTLESLQRLGLAALNQGQYERALLYARKAMFAQTQLLQRIFAFTDEQHRLAYQATVSPYSVFASLPDVPAGDLATAVLRFKGAVLDSLLAERQQIEASSDPLLRPLLARAATSREASRQLEADSMVEGKDHSALDVRRTEVEAELREIMREFARAGLGAGGLAASATTSQIASALASGALLIEMIRYPHVPDGTRLEDRYGALVIAAKEEPKWISLGGASAIDENIELYRKCVRFESTPRNVQAYQESERDNTNESALHLLLRSLHDQVWAPIEKALPGGTKTIILSPDGALNFISFATLLDAKDEFLIEKYAIRYVASGRDLLREGEVSPTELLAVFGNPDFDSQAKLIAQSGANKALAIRSSEMRDFKSISLIPLPGTKKECIGLNAQAKALGKPTEVFLGADATEAQLREIKSPRILHLATHGFFLPESKDEHPDDEQELSKGGRPVILKNPMHRSGLALAGAQNTLAAWARDEVPASDNDGIVTAEEVGALKLKGTWLVVLSACDTGAGEAKAGEGVLGLRRGFIQAGAQNLLMTLWSISDDTTVQIMRDFYDRAFASGNAPQSLLDVQREWLVKLRKENGLFDATNRAGPFIMSSQGNAGLAVSSKE
jgi:CHAT domain-containing protein/Tfp pilus assembly protein PilF